MYIGGLVLVSYRTIPLPLGMGWSPRSSYGHERNPPMFRSISKFPKESTTSVSRTDISNSVTCTEERVSMKFFDFKKSITKVFVQKIIVIEKKCHINVMNFLIFCDRAYLTHSFLALLYMSFSLTVNFSSLQDLSKTRLRLGSFQNLRWQYIHNHNSKWGKMFIDYVD